MRRTRNADSLKRVSDEIKQFEQEYQAMKAVMTLALDFSPTNEPRDIIRIYRENKTRCAIDIQGGERAVEQMVKGFFSLENTV